MKKWIIGGGLALAALAIALVFLYSKGNPSSSPQDFAKESGLAEDFTVSPDDKHLVFSSYKNGIASLYKADRDGSNLTAITETTNSHQLHPRYSPDGSSILFLSVPVERHLQNTTLYIMNADGTGLKPLTDGKTIITEATFAPDRKTIYYIQSKRYEEKASYRPIDHDLYSMNTDGSNQKRLTHLELLTMENLTISPDGTKAVYESTDPKTFGARLEVLALPVTNQPQPLTLTGGFSSGQVHDPAVLPDGKRFLFSATTDKPSKMSDELFLSEWEGKPSRQITNTQTAALNPVPLHQEQSVLFLLNPDPSLQTTDYKLMRIGLDGTGMEEISLNVQ